MRKTMPLVSLALAIAVVGGLLLTVAPNASAQRFGGVIFVGPGPFYGPYYPYYGYGFYPYGPYYMANFGQVQIDTHEKSQKSDDVYIDGGYAARLKDAKKFALRPGNHDVELRSPDGQTVYHETVAITVGHTTKLNVPEAEAGR
jgi:hypothetical protein